MPVKNVAFCTVLLTGCFAWAGFSDGPHVTKEIRIPKSVKFLLVQCKIQQICPVQIEILGLESRIQLRKSGI